MAGGLIQLVAHGVQDLYLTRDPQITFFKVLYRRHTNFAIESVVQNFTSTANFGETVSCTLARVGDLVGRIFLYVEIPALPKFEEDPIKKVAWTKNLGYALIQEIYIEIGGKIIDKQYGEWMYIWSQVSGKQDKSLDKMIANVKYMYDFTNGKPSYKLCIPLEFWFCRNTGLALPLVALAASDVKLTVTFRKLDQCYRIGPTNSIEIMEDIIPFKQGDYIKQTVNGHTINGYIMGFDYLQKRLYYIKIVCQNSPKKSFESQTSIPEIDNVYRIYGVDTNSYITPKPNSKEYIEQTALPNRPQFVNSFLYVDYVYLDTEERVKFAGTNQEYLIEQIQLNQEIGIRSPNVKQNLVLNHPCKAMYWVAQLDSLVSSFGMNDFFNYTSNQCPISGLVSDAKIILNSKNRVSKRTSEYFNLVQPYQHHHRGPSLGINLYSFSIYPENHQPSSALNMSMIESAVMQFTLNNVVNSTNTAQIRVYTINYNVLRIMFNMGGLAFA